MVEKIKKAIRFISVYGIKRTFYKALGRSRTHLKWLRPSLSESCDLGILGCGQFAFSTIGYFISQEFGSRFSACYDPDPLAKKTFADFYRVKNVAVEPFQVINDENCKIIYIASNHSTHTDYAVSALKAGKTVYIEKPICVSFEQAHELFSVVKKFPGKVFVGYNRPFSKAISELRAYCRNLKGPLTLSCTVLGHYIQPEHWYRKPIEGNRVSGNVAHWIDLATHLLFWNEKPERIQVTLAYSSREERDDNFTLSLTTERGDLVSICFTSRSDPFEGIDETIVFQQEDVTVKIDDFRKMKICCGSEVKNYRFWPKDVGHARAILQPFLTPARDWNEIEFSSLLVVFVAKMVDSGETQKTFEFRKCLAEL